MGPMPAVALFGECPRAGAVRNPQQVACMTGKSLQAGATGVFIIAKPAFAQGEPFDSAHPQW